ncbi:heterogeneous nuclear ribonucleoprotein A/B-like [Planococcus citri]|uniref:heterogeneous nuclear ribonucleoprotein A/B-like n=1 Tax=Planococcus citri TaxID=170843 RepID=UPI0031F957FF
MGDSRTSVFVSNLGPNTSDAEFVSYFRRNCAGVAYGPDAGQISRDGVGRSKGFGFINFIDSLSANVVVSKKNHVINGRRVYCKLARSYSNGPLHRRKLHVGNLNIGTTEDHLKDYFSKFGQVINVYIQLDEIDRSCSYAFVEFASLSVLDKIQAERPHHVNNKDVLTSRTYPKDVPKHLKRNSTILFVSNDNNHVTKEDIESYFSSYKILSVLESAEYVEIHFADYDDVDKICLRGETHYVKNSPVIVTKSLEDLEGKLRGDSDAEKNAKPSAPSLASLSPSRGTSFEMSAMNPQHKLYDRRSPSPYRKRYKSSEKNDCCVIL